MQADPYQIVRLPNGVCSVRSTAVAETFHPVIGPVAEAETLYVRQLRLAERMARHQGEFVIWDVGLGAAANALTALRAARAAACPVRLLSFDHTLAPLEFALRHAAELGYFGGYEAPVAALLNCGSRRQPAHLAQKTAPTEVGCHQHLVEFRDGGHAVRWSVHVADFPAVIGSPAALQFPKPHAILFDAFSPAKNPAMWTLPLFARLHALLDPARPCGLATYSRSTLLRVSLLLAGFFVGVGHATGEKEETTIAANTLDLIAEPLERRWLARAKRSNSAEPLAGPVYRRAPLSHDTWERLQAHPQFCGGAV